MAPFVAVLICAGVVLGLCMGLLLPRRSFGVALVRREPLSCSVVRQFFFWLLCGSLLVFALEFVDLSDQILDLRGV